MQNKIKVNATFNIFDFRVQMKNEIMLKLENSRLERLFETVTDMFVRHVCLQARANAFLAGAGIRIEMEENQLSGRRTAHVCAKRISIKYL